MISDEMMRRAIAPIVAQVGRGEDVVIASERGLFTLAAAGLAERMAVVRVASAVGALSLSSLIAQVSGRPDFDGQDDAVLELAFKRLSAPVPAALLLDLPHGLSRSALRYIQHVARHAPGLVLVALESPALDAALEEPGFTVLRSRLRAAAVVRPVSVAGPAVGAAPSLTAFPPAIRTMPAAPRRHTRAWTASALGMAVAAVMGGWVVHGSSLDARPALPIEADATAPPPIAPPALPAAPPPAVVTPAMPPPVVERQPAPVAVAPPPRAKSDRVVKVRRSPPPRYLVPPPQPDWEVRAPPPLAVRRELRGSPAPYVGTYAVDPSGMRIFRYDP